MAMPENFGLYTSIIYGYTHKNLNFNATYIAYKMTIDFRLTSEHKK